MKQYLAYFLRNQRYLDFCLTQFESLARLFGISLKSLYLEDKSKFNVKQHPFLKIQLPSQEIARKIAQRSTLLCFILDIYSYGKDLSSLIQNINKAKISAVVSQQSSFSFKVYALGDKIKSAEQKEIIEKFGQISLPWQGNVDLKNPDNIFHVIRNTQLQSDKEEWFFGRQVASCYDDKNNKFYSRYLLKNRKYIGPTSTDCQLAFLMANHAQVTESSLVYDPFFGTGSIMISASYFKPLIAFGSDLDIRVLQGYGVGKLNKKIKKKIDNAKEIQEKLNAFSNFQDYQLKRPQLVRMDFLNLPMREVPLFDAIICDPPYGIRAMSKQSGKKEKQPKQIAEKQDVKKDQETKEQTLHFPGTQHVDHLQIYHKLLSIAQKYLVVGGRLVFLFPQDQSLPKQSNEIPTHPKFELVSVSKNKLHSTKSRLLVKMIKICQLN